MVLGEAGRARANDSCHTGQRSRSASADDGLPRLAVVAAAHDEGGRLGAVDHVGQLAELAGRGHRAAQRALGPAGRVLVGGLGPVPHGDDDERRALGRDAPRCRRGRCAPGTSWARTGQVRPHGVLAGELLQGSAGEEGLVGELAAVLLAHHDDQRRVHVARVGDRVDRVAQPRGGVQVDQRRLAAGDGVAGGDPHHRALVQAQHEVDVGRQAGEERDLGRARIAEDGGHPEPPHDVEHRIADRSGGGARRIWIVCCGHGGALRFFDHALLDSLPGANAITYALRTIGHSAYVATFGRGAAGHVSRESQGESLCR